MSGLFEGADFRIWLEKGRDQLFLLSHRYNPGVQGEAPSEDGFKKMATLLLAEYETDGTGCWLKDLS